MNIQRKDKLDSIQSFSKIHEEGFILRAIDEEVYQKQLIISSELKYLQQTPNFFFL